MSYGMGATKPPKGYSQGRMQNFIPEQMQLLQQSISQLGPDSFLSKIAGGDQSQFAEMEAPALRQFTGMQGNLASRFSGMGGMGARNSSGFQNTMNAATSDFAQDLQSKRTGLRMQAIRDLISMSSELMGQKPYENYMVQKQYKQKQPSFLESLAGGALPGVVSGFLTGGPGGGILGGLSGFFNHSSKGYTPSAGGYDQEFRTNPAAMGY